MSESPKHSKPGQVLYEDDDSLGHDQQVWTGSTDNQRELEDRSKRYVLGCIQARCTCELAEKVISRVMAKQAKPYHFHCSRCKFITAHLTHWHRHEASFHKIVPKDYTLAVFKCPKCCDIFLWKSQFSLHAEKCNLSPSSVKKEIDRWEDSDKYARPALERALALLIPDARDNSPNDKTTKVESVTGVSVQDVCKNHENTSGVATGSKSTGSDDSSNSNSDVRTLTPRNPSPLDSETTPPSWIGKACHTFTHQTQNKPNEVAVSGINDPDNVDEGDNVDKDNCRGTTSRENPAWEPLPCLDDACDKQVAEMFACGGETLFYCNACVVGLSHADLTMHQASASHKRKHARWLSPTPYLLGAILPRFIREEEDSIRLFCHACSTHFAKDQTALLLHIQGEHSELVSTVQKQISVLHSHGNMKDDWKVLVSSQELLRLMFAGCKLRLLCICGLSFGMPQMFKLSAHWASSARCQCKFLHMLDCKYCKKWCSFPSLETLLQHAFSDEITPNHRLSSPKETPHLPGQSPSCHSKPHLSSAAYLKLPSSRSPLYECNLCKTTVRSKASWDKHIDSKSHKLSVLQHDTSDQNSSEGDVVDSESDQSIRSMCGVCSADLYHSQGPQHSLGHAMFISAKIKGLNDINQDLFCSSCKLYFDSKDVLKSHHSKLCRQSSTEPRPNARHCGVCNSSFNGEIRQHMSSKMHLVMEHLSVKSFKKTSLEPMDSQESHSKKQENIPQVSRTLRTRHRGKAVNNPPGNDPLCTTEAELLIVDDSDDDDDDGDEIDVGNDVASDENDVAGDENDVDRDENDVAGDGNTVICDDDDDDEVDDEIDIDNEGPVAQVYWYCGPCKIALGNTQLLHTHDCLKKILSFAELDAKFFTQVGSANKKRSPCRGQPHGSKPAACGSAQLTETAGHPPVNKRSARQPRSSQPPSKQLPARQPSVRQPRSSRSTSKQLATSQPAGKQSGSSQPAGKQSGSSQPAGKQSGCSQPAGKQSGSSQPAGKQSGTSQPVGKQSGTSQPAGKQSGSSQPAGKQSGSSQPAGKQSGSSQPSSKQLPACQHAAKPSSVFQDKINHTENGTQHNSSLCKRRRIESEPKNVLNGSIDLTEEDGYLDDRTALLSAYSSK